MKTVNAIVIDPVSKTIYPTTINEGEKGWDEIKKLVDAKYLELAVNFNEKALMYCDEEGWLKNETRPCFKFDGVTVPGKAIVIHDDGEMGYPIEWETDKMFKYINILTKGVTFLGEKNYNGYQF